MTTLFHDITINASCAKIKKKLKKNPLPRNIDSKILIQHPRPTDKKKPSLLYRLRWSLSLGAVSLIEVCTFVCSKKGCWINNIELSYSCQSGVSATIRATFLCRRRERKKPYEGNRIVRCVKSIGTPVVWY